MKSQAFFLMCTTIFFKASYLLCNKQINKEGEGWLSTSAHLLLLPDCRCSEVSLSPYTPTTMLAHHDGPYPLKARTPGTLTSLKLLLLGTLCPWRVMVTTLRLHQSLCPRTRTRRPIWPRVEVSSSCFKPKARVTIPRDHLLSAVPSHFLDT